MSQSSDLGNLIEQSRETPWLRDAACAELGIDQIDLFFVDAGKSLSREALAICERCPARIACVTHAYEAEIAGGYFGGISPSRRRKISLEEAVASLV